MKPSQIYQVMDMAKTARSLGRVWNPIFVGPPGIAKSAIMQDWSKKNGYGFIDIRTALREAPDLIGFPRIETLNGRERVLYATPIFWPAPGEKKTVVCFDEVNRGNTSVLNAIMQILTDRKIGDFELSEDAIICAAINPEDEQNDVNMMDSALKDRFEFFTIDYDKNEHVAYMKARNYEQSIIDWVDSRTWMYRRPEQISAEKAGDKYLSPRSLEKLDTAMKSGGCDNGRDFELMIYTETLGQLNGASFYQFRYNERPVAYSEILDENTRKEALRRLEKYSDPNDYKAGIIALTIRDIVADGKIEDDLLCQVLLVLPADQGPKLLYQLERARNDDANELSRRILKNKKIHKYFNERLTTK